MLRIWGWLVNSLNFLEQERNVLSLAIPKGGQWRRKRVREALDEARGPRYKISREKPSRPELFHVEGRLKGGKTRGLTNAQARRDEATSMVYGRGRQTARDNHWSPDSQTIKAFVQSPAAFLSIHTCSKVLWTMPKLASPAHSPGLDIKILEHIPDESRDLGAEKLKAAAATATSSQRTEPASREESFCYRYKKFHEFCAKTLSQHRCLFPDRILFDTSRLPCIPYHPWNLLIPLRFSRDSFSPGIAPGLSCVDLSGKLASLATARFDQLPRSLTRRPVYSCRWWARISHDWQVERRSTIGGKWGLPRNSFQRINTDFEWQKRFDKINPIDNLLWLFWNHLKMMHSNTRWT